MKGSLTRKLIAFYIILVCSLFLVLNTVVAGLMEKSIIAKREQTIYKQTGIIIDGYVRQYYDNRILVSKLLENLEPVAELLDARILITSSWGKVVADTAPLNNEVLLLEDVAPGFLDETFHRDFYNPAVVDEPMLAVVVPLTYQYMVKGYVCMMMPMESVNREVSAAIYEMNWYYLAVIIILLFVFLGMYFIFVIPLRRTIAAAKAYSMGNFEKKLNIHSRGEFRALADYVPKVIWPFYLGEGQ